MRVALLGRPGPLPFAGAFAGTLEAAPLIVAWAGRVAAGDDVELGWRASRAIQRALVRAGPPQADRLRALSILWARIDGVSRDALGPSGGDDLVLLLAAADDTGASVTGVGLGGVYAGVEGQPMSAWISPPHPLLGDPGIPKVRPGALTIDEMPPWLVGVARHEALATGDLGAALAACGVRR